MLISPAYAADAAQPDPIMSFLPLIVIFVIFYFLIIRPQMKRTKDHKALVEARMVQDGQTTDNATQLRTWVEGLLGAQAPIRLTTDVIDRGLQVKLEGSWK